MKTKRLETTENPFPLPEMNPSGSGRSRWKRWLMLTGLPLLVIAAFFWFKNDNKSDISYQTQPVIKGNLTLSVVATGNLEPTNQVDVGSELSGIIKTVEADYNDPVKKGQVLARLDTTRLNAEVLQAQATLSKARAGLEQARATLEQARNQSNRFSSAAEISKGKAVSQTDVDAARADLNRALADEASAQATVSQTRATLDANLTDLSKTEIRSPINGVVLTRSVEPGQTVAASLSSPVLFKLAEDLSQMALHVAVDEADVGRVKGGQEAQFTVDAYPEQKFSARVIQVRYGPSTTSGVVTYMTIMKVDNKNLLLMPGMTATAEITVKKITDALLAPNAALRYTPPFTEAPEKESRGVVGFFLPRFPSHGKRPSGASEVKNQKQVWVLRDEKPVPVNIAIGESDGVMTEITGGDVKIGDLFITDSSGGVS